MNGQPRSVLEVPIENGYPAPNEEIRDGSAEDFAVRHAAANNSPSAQAELFLGFASEQAKVLLSQAQRFADEQVTAARKQAAEIVEAAKEQAARIEELWKKRREDHEAVIHTYDALEEHAYKSVKSAIDDKESIFRLLRTPVKAPKTGGELAYMGFRQILNTAESIVTKDPKLLGSVAKLLTDVAEKPSEAEQKPPEEAKAQPEEAQAEDIGKMPVDKLAELLSQMSPEELGGKSIKDLTLGETFALVQRKYAPAA